MALGCKVFPSFKLHFNHHQNRQNARHSIRRRLLVPLQTASVDNVLDFFSSRETIRARRHEVNNNSAQCHNNYHLRNQHLVIIPRKGKNSRIVTMGYHCARTTYIVSAGCNATAAQVTIISTLWGAATLIAMERKIVTRVQKPIQMPKQYCIFCFYNVIIVVY